MAKKENNFGYCTVGKNEEEMSGEVQRRENFSEQTLGRKERTENENLKKEKKIK